MKYIVDSPGSARRLDMPEHVAMSRIPRKYQHFVFGVIQSGITCCVAAAIASTPFYNDGSFIAHWLHAYLFSWAVMLPIVVVVAPFVRRLADVVTD